MRSILAGVMVIGLAGCGLRYIGSEDQMQQVARGTAELMKKDPYSDTVTAAGSGAHLALKAIMSTPETAAPQVHGAFADEAKTQHDAYMELLRKRPSMYGPRDSTD
ncbi:hypothetical protein [Cupriavidus necator]|uniref:hypothetical protein n=1 Tax=Cupriavidus necator TaxID=106590 RepID=UPI00339D459B